MLRRLLFRPKAHEINILKEAMELEADGLYREAIKKYNNFLDSNPVRKDILGHVGYLKGLLLPSTKLSSISTTPKK